MINKNLEKVKIKKNSSIDVRSYKLYAGKILSIGFKKSKSSNDAIIDLINNFNNKKIKNRKTNLRSVFLSQNLKKFYG
jgi:phosphomevalonate kinase